MKQLTGYRVHVAVIRSDTKGKILQTMASGRQATRETRDEALAYAKEFAHMADAIPGGFAAYGAVIVICQKTGDIVTSRPLRRGVMPITATERV